MRVAALVLLLAACSRPTPRPGERPPSLADTAIDEQLGQHIPLGLVLTNSDGRPIRLGSLFTDGRPVLLILAYFRCPMLCSLVVSGAADAIRRSGWQLGRELRAVTVSFDPEDTPDEARRKQASTLADLDAPPAAWPFLVGDADAIAALTTSVGFHYRYDPRTDQFAHAAVVIALSPDGRISRYLYGVQPRPNDVKLALLDAAGGRARSLSDQLLMLCFRYDPASRRYGLFIARFLQLGAALTLLTVAGLLIILWRADRRRAARSGAGL